MIPVRRLGVIANPSRAHAETGRNALLRAASEAGIALYVEPNFAPLFPGAEPCPPDAFASKDVQGVVSLGGDGSLLAAAHTLDGSPLPLIGLNVGHLGYLTAANEEGFGVILSALAAGHYTIEARSTLSAVLDAPSASPFQSALNDVVISRAEGGRAIALLVALDGAPVARYLCDGLILSTPTGSTAYALSVGGPVVAPTARVLVLSVIAPHALSARPLVVPESTRIEIRVDPEGADRANVYTDGISRAELPPGGALRVEVSPTPVRLMVPEGHSPYAALARKLGWSAAFTR